MITYKHTQIGYLMIAFTIVVSVLFVWLYMMAAAEPVSVDSGPNFAITAIMSLIMILLASFSTLTVSVDENFLRIKFGYGLFSKSFQLSEIASVARVKNKWYYGWGVRLWLWPKMWIYTISGLQAVEIITKNGKIYRIGTDIPVELETAIMQTIHT